MNYTPRAKKYFLAAALMSIVATAVTASFWSGPRASAQDTPAPSTATKADALLEGFRHVEVASVSDAVEQILGRKMNMSRRVQAIFPTKFAGYAITFRLKKDEGNKDPDALAGMIAAIDAGAKDSVYVMTVEDGADIAGMGGLMGTTMYSRGFAG